MTEPSMTRLFLMSDTYEVEVKIAISSYEEMEDRILKLGAEKINKETQIDSYFDHPCRTFQETDEALRVRYRQPVGTVELTYKGPRIDSTTKTRLESTVNLDNENEIVLILKGLGFKEVVKITKTRQFFSLSKTTISIDEVEDVGLFLEIEQIASGKDVETTKNEIFAMLDELGLDASQTIRESYLELYLNQ
ncbi:MAG: class IV adenylate cyclase [Candidatus Thorarchaeota archaeon]